MRLKRSSHYRGEPRKERRVCQLDLIKSPHNHSSTGIEMCGNITMTECSSLFRSLSLWFFSSLLFSVLFSVVVVLLFFVVLFFFFLFRWFFFFRWFFLLSCSLSVYISPQALGPRAADRDQPGRSTPGFLPPSQCGTASGTYR